MLKKIIALLFLIPSLALAAEFIEGKDYQQVTNAQLRDQNNKTPNVIEFFSYGCPWCYKLETPINDWLKKIGNQVQFERIPVVFKPEWELYAKAFYTAKLLALSDKLNPLLFKTIQVDKNLLNTNPTMIQFFVSQGVDKEIASSAFEHSSTIDMRVKDGMNLMVQAQINAVPAFVINSKYKTDLQMAGNTERLIEILDYLVRK